jgi:hypothetical protein
MHSKPQSQPKPGPSGHENTDFDPAGWLDWAERCGYRLYLLGLPSGGGYRIVTEAPCRPKSADDMALWHEFQGDPQHNKANRAALIAHLVKTGRFGPRARDGRLGSKPAAGGSKPPHPKPSGRSAQDGR